MVGDGSRFTGGPYGFGWEWDDFSDEEFPQISGLEVNEGVLSSPCRAGQCARKPGDGDARPADGLRAAGRQRKDRRERGRRMTARSHGPGIKIIFRDRNTAAGKDADTESAGGAPATAGGGAAAGGASAARHRAVGGAALGKTPPSAVVLAAHPSLPLSEYIVRMNKPSDNLLAESSRAAAGQRAARYDAGHVRETPFFAVSAWTPAPWLWWMAAGWGGAIMSRPGLCLSFFSGCTGEKTGRFTTLLCRLPGWTAR